MPRFVRAHSRGTRRRCAGPHGDPWKENGMKSRNPAVTAALRYAVALVGLLLAAGLAFAQSMMGPLDAGNRQGADIDPKGTAARDAEACSNLCAKMARCRAMAFVLDPHPAEGVCRLKYRVPPLAAGGNTTSAVKL